MRILYLGTGAVLALLAFGFLADQAWATSLWPFYTYRMSRIFIASILLSIAASATLIGLSREWAAARGGAINLCVTFAIMAVYALATAGSDAVRLFGLVAAGLAVLYLGIYLGARRMPFRDLRPTPKPVLWSYAAFALILIPVGSALLADVENVLPWWVDRDLSVLYGAVFLGAATFYIHALVVPVWGAARAPHAGFLAYDLVLIGPFLALMPSVRDEYRASLIIYTLVIVYSGILAMYYLWRGPEAALSSEPIGEPRERPA